MTTTGLTRDGSSRRFGGSDPSESSDDPFDHSLDSAVLVGVWADSTRVHRGRNEFTVDFIRHVPVLSYRVLVARALLSPILAVELRDQLDEAWRGYSDVAHAREQPMIERDPLSDRILNGEIYRFPAPPRQPRREPDPEVLEIVRRGREKLIRDYLERRRAK